VPLFCSRASKRNTAIQPTRRFGQLNPRSITAIDAVSTFSGRRPRAVAPAASVTLYRIGLTAKRPTAPASAFVFR